MLSHWALLLKQNELLNIYEMFAAVLATSSSKPSAGTLLTVKHDSTLFRFIWLSSISYFFFNQMALSH